ncbi:hypothetical protein AUK04_00250 [Candidatus Roizmanbacteria bacterium CG2_30_33_16]|uniref:Endolytic murein transglycosylase n=4 Tax=Candidatus Roizmaniibacteriota TaxID=1752723 RepID=A0A2H0C588_9BACT|nr:endolytic transglycosylase MltG [Candidatus Roizmanbacteria bacterium]OIP86626.1 MAG: hypothetical protein AUK04_00250 [Candidatus Roizmanbacteria bacterium CG2_30_33_16]PIP64550.1 MAG: hypothetical protein COW96_01925 [Candidatus Roizmanbacteria bacterium CG22_combo_CG10-13_8_21_14_all_33_16]PIX70279.1 MAG: endolytic transglycosylase MltG [Candidatus Roizmanbacteria bacterium CG_4_10_14_3_um_filter_33_21]PJB88941.1 MAG: endolytic transglycosylase MltG [Candidatus Roizmanbacteria bacterium C
MNKFVVFIITLFILIFIGFIFIREGNMPVNKNDKTNVIFLIKPGENLNQITNNLSKNNLIRNKISFYLVVKKLGIERKIQAGDFRLSPSMSAETIANNLTHGTIDIWVTLLEGWRREEAAQAIYNKISIPEIEIVQAFKEGYIFPDTYLFPKTSSIDNLVKIINSNFDNKFKTLSSSSIKKLGLTTNQVITIASLVEREVKLPDDRQKVASIIYKRWKNDWALNIDATIQYTLGYQASEMSWWKKELSADDLKLESPYNTYIHTGLPPTPICNPSLSSLTAITEIDPNFEAWFYISDKTGKMHYSKTLEEHNTNVKRYLR